MSNRPFIAAEKDAKVTRTVGIADMYCSDQADDLIITHALGSCLGVTVFDRVAGVGGMVHIMLPQSKMDETKAKEKPCMFVDTGVPALFRAAYALGARKENIVLKVAGGAQILDADGHFRIGERNFVMLRKILWKNNVLIASQDVGGAVSRTLMLDVGTGEVSIRSNGQVKELQ